MFLYRQVLDWIRDAWMESVQRDATEKAKRIGWFRFPNVASNRSGSKSKGLASCIRAISLRDMVPCGCLTRLQKSIRRPLVSFSGSLYFRQVGSARILGQERFAGTTCMRIPFRSLCELLCFVRALTRRSVVVVKPGSIGVKPAGVRALVRGAK